MEAKKYAQHSRLRRARELRGWTQKEVADCIHLPDTRTLRRWESGETIPSPRYRTKLSEIFGMSLQELGFISEQEPQIPENKESNSEIRSAPDQVTPAKILKFQAPLFSDILTSSSPDNSHRQRLLKKLQTYWTEEILKQALPEHRRLVLDFQVQMAAVANPWNQLIQLPQPSIHSLPPDTSIIQVYEDACGELLILGEPGAGKTTLLLELTHDLLHRAYASETHLIPVFLNLSSWFSKQSSFGSWLVWELNSKYQVPEGIGQSWVEGGHILPLLDGLDEVNPTLRKGCLDAINAYRQAHGLVPMVITSRREEYLGLKTQLLLQQAVYILPLTPQKIDCYLSGTGNHLEILRSALHNDRELQQLITTPLMLSILTLAYQGRSVEELDGLTSIEMGRKLVFATYVECMLKRRKSANRYSPQQCIRWLTYLALQMKRNYPREADLKQLILRLMFRFEGQHPWNYAHFLEYAAECILLRKVGNGYVFAHHLLLDYFVSLGETY